MFNLVEIVVLGLATFRLASLLVNEDGPFLMFLRLRLKAGVIYWNTETMVVYGNKMAIEEAQHGRLYDLEVATSASNEFAKALNCVWCSSIWVSLFLTIPYALIVGLAPFAAFVVWLALSAIAGLLYNSYL
jgi:hypothetical protein